MFFHKILLHSLVSEISGCVNSVEEVKSIRWVSRHEDKTKRFGAIKRWPQRNSRAHMGRSLEYQRRATILDTLYCYVPPFLLPSLSGTIWQFFLMHFGASKYLGGILFRSPQPWRIWNMIKQRKPRSINSSVDRHSPM